jgi:flagellar biosynthetic protein FlhB
MPEEPFQDRTEPATPRKREEARQRGQVARSVDLNSAVILLAGLITLHFLGSTLYNQMAAFTISTLGEIHAIEITQESLKYHVLSGIFVFAKMLGPILIILAVIGFTVSYVQVGALFSWDPLIPRFGRLNPIAGVSKLLSTRAFVDLFKNLLKVTIIGYIGYDTVKDRIADFIPLVDAGVGTIFEITGAVAYTVGIRMGIALLILAILDYAFQRWEYERSLRMTRQEIKEEHKRLEGDPAIRARIRSVQREMARRRMMQEVPRAEVVITNPTHIAVALRYDSTTMTAPVVVAKGQGLIAEKIKEIAVAHGIPVIEDKPLAQTLFKLVEVGMEIPEQLYRAVAEILAYVFRLKGSS